MNLVAKWLAEIQRLKELVEDAQNKCAHPEDAVMSSKSLVHYYGPDDNYYVKTCRLCLKNWKESKRE